MYLVDVVIPVFGRFDLLEKCLSSLSKQDNVNVIIVDDFSPHDLVQVNKFYGDLVRTRKVRVIRNGKNEGFPRTCNTGVSKGKAPLILLLNSDVELEQGAVAAMVKELDEPGVGVVGALLTFPEGTQYGVPGTVQHAGMAFDSYGKPFHVHIGWNPSNLRVNKRKIVSCVTGACLMTRRGLWNEIGGLAAVYGKGTFEDVEFCVQAQLKGKTVVFTPEARGTHYVGQSSAAQGTGYPLKENYELFRRRVPVIWDEYRVW